MNPMLKGFILCFALQAVVLLVAWALCAIGADADERMEAAYRAELRRRGKRG